MKPAEFQKEIAEVVLDEPARTEKQYRTRGAIFTALGITCWLASAAVAVVFLLLILGPTFGESSSLIGWVVFMGGAFLGINGIFDLARNLNYAALFEYKKANILKLDGIAHAPEVDSGTEDSQ